MLISQRICVILIELFHLCFWVKIVFILFFFSSSSHLLLFIISWRFFILIEESSAGFYNSLHVRINLPLFSTVVPAVTFVFLSCGPFVAITTLSTGFVGVEVTSVSWLEQLTVGV